MSPMIKVSLFACVLALYGRENLGLVPSTPCRYLFNYFESKTSEIIASTTFRNDLSGTYDLEVNISVPRTDTNKTLTSRLVSREFNIQQGGSIEYDVGFFPHNHSFPKLTSVKFNGMIYCSEPPEVATKDHEVTTLSTSNHFETTISEDAFKRRGASSTTTTPETVGIKIRGEDQCGINIDYKPLVIVGNPTRSGEYPWLVAIFVAETTEGYRFICGGSLVSKRHVITAAHCIYGTDKSKDDFIVALGKHNIKNWVLGATIRALKAYYIHPDYRQPADADIAVLLLAEPVTYSATLRAICMWDESDSLSRIVERRGTVAGWGKDESGLEWVEEPKQIELPIVPQETCLWSDARFVKLTSSRTFCAGKINKTRGPCTGDSGGGFVMNRDGIWKLRGIVSVALQTPSRTCDVNSYIVFTDVPKYAGWLKEIMAHL